MDNKPFKSIKLAMDIVSISKKEDGDSCRIIAIKDEIAKMYEALFSNDRDRIIAANANACKFFPEVYYIPNGNLVKVEYDKFLTCPLEYQIASLRDVIISMMTLLEQEKRQQDKNSTREKILETGKSVLGYFDESNFEK